MLLSDETSSCCRAIERAGHIESFRGFSVSFYTAKHFDGLILQPDPGSQRIFTLTTLVSVPPPPPAITASGTPFTCTLNESWLFSS